MKYDLSDRVVIGIASSALFGLADCDAVFREQGEDAYRRYQEAHVDDVLDRGVAFPFVRRLLSLNDLAGPLDPLVEVIVLSRNDPDTGLRVMRSIAAHGLHISRAVFQQGRSSHRFMRALNMSLFLSANGPDVRDPVADGLPAGHVLETERVDDDTDEAPGRGLLTTEGHRRQVTPAPGPQRRAPGDPRPALSWASAEGGGEGPRRAGKPKGCWRPAGRRWCRRS